MRYITKFRNCYNNHFKSIVEEPVVIYAIEAEKPVVVEAVVKKVVTKRVITPEMKEKSREIMRK
jgi:hypothetical protein